MKAVLRQASRGKPGSSELLPEAFPTAATIQFRQIITVQPCNLEFCTFASPTRSLPPSQTCRQQCGWLQALRHAGKRWGGRMLSSCHSPSPQPHSQPSTPRRMQRPMAQRLMAPAGLGGKGGAPAPARCGRTPVSHPLRCLLG
jgi:hypothetical protein